MLLDNKEFEFYKEAYASKEFTILNLDTDERILEYQIQMLGRNPNVSILRMDLRRTDDKLKLYYETTSLITLEELLFKRKLKGHELIDLLLNIIKTIVESKNYLLYENGFIISADYIYIHPLTLNASLIYVPLPLNQDLNNQFKTFVTNLIVYTVQLDETMSDNSLQRMLHMLKSDTFSLMNFHKLLGELKSGASVNSFIIKEPENHPVRKLDHKTVQNKKKAPIKASMLKRSMHIVLVQLLSIALFTLLYVILYFSKSLDVVSLLGIVLITGAADFFLMKAFLNGREKANKDIVIQNKMPMTHENLCVPQNILILPQESLTETVVIKPSIKVIPFIQHTQDGIIEKIPLTKFPFTIGRTPQKSDYISKNHAIGNQHAEILSNEEGYFIRDLSSKNGTFINDFQISSQVAHQIRHNDRLTFADSEFTFILANQSN